MMKRHFSVTNHIGTDISPGHSTKINTFVCFINKVIIIIMKNEVKIQGNLKQTNILKNGPPSDRQEAASLSVAKTLFP